MKAAGEEIQADAGLFPCRMHCLMIVLVSSLLLLPAFTLGAGGFDLHCQSLWVKHFSAQFWHGDLYPRWLIDMYAGNGSPVFFYYPPLTYFITAFFAFLIPFDPFGYTAIAASAWLATCIAGIAFYIWMKEETGNAYSTLVGSLLYMTAPISVGYNFYTSLLFSSLWAYAWVPLLFLSAKKSAQGWRYGIPALALMLFLLVMTNLPLTLIWGPTAVAYGLYKRFLAKEKLLPCLLRMLAAVMLGFAMAAIYIVPMLSYMDYSNVSNHWAVQGYEHFFLILGFERINQRIYTTYFLFLLLLTLFYGWTVPREVRERRFLLFFSLLGLFMILSFSKLLWEYIPILKIIQFPERFFIVPSMCLAALACYASRRTHALAYMWIVAYCAANIGLAAWGTRITMDQFKAMKPIVYEMYSLNIDQYFHYLSTRRLAERFYSKEGIDQVRAHPEQLEVMEGEAQVSVKEWKPRHLMLHYKASQDFVLRVRQFYFPGWEAFLGDAALNMKRDRDNGEMLLEVPAGEGDIRMELTAMMPEIAGKGVTLVALLVFSFLVLNKINRGRYASEEPVG